MCTQQHIQDGSVARVPRMDRMGTGFSINTAAANQSANSTTLECAVHWLVLCAHGNHPVIYPVQ